MAEQTHPLSTGGRADADAAVAPDAWRDMRRFTSARIAIGRTGGSVRSASLLDFRLAHARARDAVQREFRVAEVEAELQGAGLETCRIATGATERHTYLVRPDLGRRLAESSRVELEARRAAWGARDLAIIVSDGLSALAAERQAVPTLRELVPLLQAARWTLWPIFVAPLARVKLQDEVGELLGARHALVLLGERPGLGAPDSLGAYFTFQPRAACTDADRNCVSNIRPEGLPPAEAARKLAQWLTASAQRKLSGVALKDEGDGAEAGARVERVDEGG